MDIGENELVSKDYWGYNYCIVFVVKGVVEIWDVVFDSVVRELILIYWNN